MHLGRDEHVPWRKKGRRRANMAHIRQSRPVSGLGFQIKNRKIFQVVLSSLGRCYGFAGTLLGAGAGGVADIFEYLRRFFEYLPRFFSASSMRLEWAGRASAPWRRGGREREHDKAREREREREREGQSERASERERDKASERKSEREVRCACVCE